MINQIMYDDITKQPQALSESLIDLRNQKTNLFPSTRKWGKIFFTGSGDSFFAPLSLQYIARDMLELLVYVITPMEVAHYWKFNKSDIVVAISFSGKTARTVQAAQIAKDQGAYVVAITSDAESPLAQTSDVVLRLRSYSRSRSIPHTIDYTLTLLAIAVTIETLAQKKIKTIDILPKYVDQTINQSINTCREVGNHISKNESFYFLGAGPNWGTAQYGAAKFMEACGIHASAFELEEFAHGPHKLVGPNDPVFIISPEGKSKSHAKKIVKGLTKLNAKPYMITNNSEFSHDLPSFQIPLLPEKLSPFLSCIPLQLLTWAVASEKGYDVNIGEGRVKNIEKVRKIQKFWIRP
ncbi:SIS domain-containing protein [Thermoproteota archaeon]